MIGRFCAYRPSKSHVGDSLEIIGRFDDKESQINYAIPNFAIN